MNEGLWIALHLRHGDSRAAEDITLAMIALLSIRSVLVSAAIAAAAIFRWPSAPGLRSSLVSAFHIFAAVSVVIRSAMLLRRRRLRESQTRRPSVARPRLMWNHTSSSAFVISLALNPHVHVML